MKIYAIRRNPNGAVECLVRSDGNRLEYPLQHVEVHSPTGFECGYGGSGPADLALSILTDWFQVPDNYVKHAAKHGGHDSPARRVVALHEEFKREIIAAIHLNPGQIQTVTGDEIARFCANAEMERA